MTSQHHAPFASSASDGRRLLAGRHALESLLRSPFTAESTALQVIEGVDLSGRQAIVTGAGSGIGVETARALAHAGSGVMWRPEP